MANPEVHIIVDWDDVEFRTDDFKKEIFGRLHALSGLPLKTIKELYALTKDVDGYNDEALALAVSEQTAVDAGLLLEALRSSLEFQENEYMFDDALSFNKQASLRHPMGILTAGPRDTQRRKIEGSGQAKYFDEIYYVTNDQAAEKKADFLRWHHEKTGAGIIYIDNQISTILHHHEALRDIPAIVPVFLDRSRDDKSPSSSFTWNGLSLNALARTLPLVGKSRPVVIGMQYDKDGHASLVEEG